MVSVANGVYIQDINGRLYTASEWSKSLTPNGLAVVTDSCRFVASLVYYGDAEMSYSEYVCDYPVLQIYTTSNFLPIVASSSTAAYDFEGRTNTEAILSVSQGFGSPAKTCSNYIFPNGQNGYLGAAGEMFVFYQLRSSLNSLFYRLYELKQVPSGVNVSGYPDAVFFTSTRGQNYVDSFASWNNYNRFWETGMRNGKADLWQGGSSWYDVQMTVPLTSLEF